MLNKKIFLKKIYSFQSINKNISVKFLEYLKMSDFKCLKCGAHGLDVLGKEMLCANCCRYNKINKIIEIQKNIIIQIIVNGV